MKKRKVIKYFLGSGLVVIIAVLILFANKWRNDKLFGRITVKGNITLSSEELLNAAGLKSDSLINIEDLNLVFIQDRISKHPEIKKAYVSKEPPDELIIEIVEKRPIAIVNTGAELYLVDEEAELFSFRNYEKLFDLPVINGLTHQVPAIYKRNDDISEELLLAVNILKQVYSKGKFLQNQISEINFSDSEKVIIYSNDKSVPFYFPKYKNQLAAHNNAKDITAKDIIFRVNIFKKFIEEEYLKNLSRKYEYVDIRYSNQVVAKFN
jgi:cell division septal protein FtsQ